MGNETGDDEQELHDVDQSVDEVSRFLKNGGIPARTDKKLSPRR